MTRAALYWALDSGYILRQQSHDSFYSQLRPLNRIPIAPKACSSTKSELANDQSNCASVSNPPCKIENIGMGHSVQPKCHKGEIFEWRTDLLATEPFWHGWYTNLSNDFLSTKHALSG